jgi:DivIVA domain-containing protein
MQIRFSASRFAGAYDMEEVDAFLDRCERALVRADGSLTADDVRAQRFTTVKFQVGYEMAEVDEFLDSVLVPMLQDPQRHPYDPEHDYSVGGRRAETGPSDDAHQQTHPVQQRSGFLSRLFGGAR